MLFKTATEFFSQKPCGRSFLNTLFRSLSNYPESLVEKESPKDLTKLFESSIQFLFGVFRHPSVSSFFNRLTIEVIGAAFEYVRKIR